MKSTKMAVQSKSRSALFAAAVETRGWHVNGLGT